MKRSHSPLVVATLAVVAALTSGLTTPPPQAQAAPASTLSPPLAVVMDLSGSMNDDDGTGRVKLDGAKEGLVKTVQGQASRGQRIGVWTYPGGAEQSGCSAGSWLAPVEKHDPVSLSATINGVTADGNTPTGPALRAVADSLKQNGTTNAVVLLVSDGLSNCGPPPCEVAREIVAEGFDVTVEAVGFQIDEKGRDELTCVAQATQGHYHDVNDTAELEKQIQALTQPTLELSIEAPSTVTSGDIATIAATVTNPTAQLVADVTVTMVPTGGETGTLFPAIIPPRVPLGNLPANTSRSYAWEFPMGSILKGGTATLRVTASSGGTASAVTQDIAITTLGTDAGLAPTTWLGKAVAPGSTSRIAIFGDSYSAGEGAGAYIASTTERDVNECHQSYRTYLGQVSPNVRIIACSGAVTANVTATSQWGQPAQINNPLLTVKDSPVDVAFMTIGGNDIGFADILTACVTGSDWPNPNLDCDESYEYMPQQMIMYKETLKNTYKRVYNAINAPDMITSRGHVAPLVILPYPNVVPKKATGSCGMDAGELAFAQRLVNSLNATIEEAVGEVRASAAAFDGFVSYDGILFASPVRSAFGTHTMCSSDPWFHTPTLVKGALKQGSWDFAELGHPTADGYAATTRAIQAWAATQNLDPMTLPLSLETLMAYDGRVDEIPTNIIHAVTPQGGRASQGVPVGVSAEGFAPNSQVLLTVQSIPYAIGTAKTDDGGHLNTVVTVPPYVPVGAHHLVLDGLDPDLNRLELRVPLTVGAQPPPWHDAVPIATAALALLGSLALVAGLLIRRSTRQGPRAKAD